MIIISDTSVLTNLIQLDQLSLLEKLFGHVLIPKKVFSELSKIPGQIPIIERISWIEIRSASNSEIVEKLAMQLDLGEAESIALAIEEKADLLLIDERKGRRIAQQNGILITGLLGILIEAKAEKHLKEVKPLLDKLIFEIGFRVSPKLYQQVLTEINE